MLLNLWLMFNIKPSYIIYFFQNSSKSSKNNDEALKELRDKLLNLNKSKKKMDESFDIDNFEIPLNEKRTYSIIEVFQVNTIRFDIDETLRIFKIKYLLFFLSSFGSKFSKKLSNSIEGSLALY